MDSVMLASFNSFAAHVSLPGVHRKSTTESSGAGKSFGVHPKSETPN